MASGPKVRPSSALYSRPACCKGLILHILKCKLSIVPAPRYPVTWDPMCLHVRKGFSELESSVRVALSKHLALIFKWDNIAALCAE